MRFNQGISQTLRHHYFTRLLWLTCRVPWLDTINLHVACFWLECYFSLVSPWRCAHVTSSPPAAKSRVRYDGVTPQEASFNLLTFPASAFGVQLASACQQELMHSRLPTCSPVQEKGFTPVSHLFHTHSRRHTQVHSAFYVKTLSCWFCNLRCAAGSCLTNVTAGR